MAGAESLDCLADCLKQQHRFSDGSIEFLREKGLGEDEKKKDFSRLLEIMNLPDQNFNSRRSERSWTDILLDQGDAAEITTGRYEKNVARFRDISSEQALVQGRMKFAIEYDIEIADAIASSGTSTPLVQRTFSEKEKIILRSIYKNFKTKDFAAVKILEGRINQDIVAANTWVAIRAQQEGLDIDLMRALTHFARTSDDVNANINGRLYSAAVGEWTSTLSKLISTLKDKAKEYEHVTCVATTHGQEAQLTTLGHIYANFAEQIRQHAEPFLREKPLKLEGKIAGAIGTDVDMKASFPDLEVEPMYRGLVENVFGLDYVDLGNDQSLTHAALNRTLDAMVNVGLAIKKEATDTWIYASRHILAKKTKKGESGSSVMPQKTNPFFAESCEALMPIVAGIVTPLKDALTAYRTQGDLRRSITSREGFHPIMLSIIGMERMIGEINNYSPHIPTLEAEIARSGPQIAASAVQTYLRSQGVPDAYDRLKDLTMRPNVDSAEVAKYVGKMVDEKVISPQAGEYVSDMLSSVMKSRSTLQYVSDPSQLVTQLIAANIDVGRRNVLLGNAIPDTYKMIERADQAVKLLSRYKIQEIF